MRRLKDEERGAVAVVVALMLVALFGAAAIAVDVGALWADRRQLQNGADAAALAVAQECTVLDGCVSTQPSYTTTAETFAVANTSVPFRGAADAAVESVTLETNAAGNRQVTVVTEGEREHMFAPLLGIDSSDVSASATVEVGRYGGLSTLPLAISACQFYWQTGIDPLGNPGGVPPATTTPLVLYLKTATVKDVDVTTQCYLGTGAHNEVGGGFGWLDLDPLQVCKATLTPPNIVGSDPGADGVDCLTLHDGDEGRTVFIPIFTKFSGNGENATYEVAGSAAFKVTAYCFTKDAWTDFSIVSPKCTNANGDDGARLEGYFTSYATLDGDIGGSFTNYGAWAVRLIK